MADQFQIIPYKVRSAGTDVPPEEIQTAINSLASQTQIALNSVASDPTGPAGGDLGGNYPNPTVVSLHVTSGTESGVAVTGNTINNSPIGATTPSTGAFTTLTATTPVGAASGGTGQNTLSAHNVLLGEGTGPVGFAAPGVTAQPLVSNGSGVDPSFQTLGVAGGGTGQASLLLHGVMIGEGTGAVHTTAGTTGQMLIGATGADPAFGNTVSTLTATSTITPSTTAGIVGTTLADNAQAGSVGEYVTATGTAVSLTTNTNANITSISLTAGDWDVWGNVVYNPAGTTVISFGQVSVSTTSLTAAASPLFSVAGNGANGGTGSFLSAVAPMQRLNLSVTTTVFLVAQAAFTVSTCTATGIIQARRRR